ncbi:MAG: T9SS C-terminal target domain-containing protein [Bacteroidetes bacterium]|nr:MAG: T9SS C-terminal target domain-containing protein [Bacteroidota bacterium]MBL1145545.1 T9SS C-terminal target domain-containing protein [Bacteroidota bacterium]NOG58342.1 T9SS type A sorting domain-containing protein [Bacteroidota bacterium]
MELKFVLDMFYLNKTKKLRVITQSLFFILPLFSYSQVVQDITFSTGSKAKDVNNLLPIISYQLKDYSSQKVLFSFYKSGANNKVEKKVEIEIGKTSFNQQSIKTIWNRDTLKVFKNFYGEYGIATSLLYDSVNHVKYFFETYVFHDSTSTVINLYSVKNNTEKDSLIFYKILANRKLLLFPFIHDSKVITFTSSGNAQSFIGHIEKFDFQGNLILQRIIDYNNLDVSKDFSIHNYWNPKLHPLVDSLFTIETTYGGYFMVTLNIKTLNTVNRIGINQQIGAYLANTYRYAGANSYGFHIDSTGVEMGGYVSMLNANNSFDNQFFTCKIAWDSTLISFHEYGDTLIDERAYAFVKQDSIKYLVGASPRNTNDPYATEYRKVVLYRISPSQVDTISLYGNKNHIAENLIVDDSGDVFIASSYSNAWSNDSIYLVVTKIPHQIFLSIAEQKISRKIELYPNPTSGILNSIDFKFGNHVLIYNIKGQLVLQSTISNEGVFDAKALKAGTYFIQVRNVANSKATLFIKTE